MASNLPITKVVLFKHGVAYIERQGAVQEDQEINMFFKSKEMNDVLKSLTTLDLDGGVISSISYAANRSVQDQLQDVAISLPDEGNSLTGLLEQLKGCKVRVTLQHPVPKMEGTVIGIESLFSPKLKQLCPHLSLWGAQEGKLHSVNLMELVDLEFLDEPLKADLAHVLQVLIAAKKKDSKPLTIFASGEGKRRVLVSYIIEAPVWKTSFRVLLNKDNDKEATIQCYGLVDNTQDEDWNHVRLSLVAGLPISFVHDLYNPRYRQRPVVEVKDEEAYAPPVLEEALERRSSLDSSPSCFSQNDVQDKGEEECKPSMSMSSMGLKKRSRMGAGGALAAAAIRAPSMASAADRAKARESSNEPSVRTMESGDLFHYEIKHAVTVKRNGAALVPIFIGKTEAKRLLVYNASVRDKNPMATVLLINKTGLNFEGGPVTVLEEENYVGEAMLDTIRPNDEKYLPFAVELGVKVSSKQDSSNGTVHEIMVQDGVWTEYYYSIQAQQYEFNNTTGKKLNLILEHPISQGYDLFETVTYKEKTENYYRFMVELEPGKTTTFVVKQRRILLNSHHIQNVDQKTVLRWIADYKIDEQTKKIIEEVIQAKNEKMEIERQLQLLRQRVTSTMSNQQRLREQLRVLGSKTADEQKLRARYVKEMTNDEDNLDTLAAEQKKSEQQCKEKEQQFIEKLRNVKFSKIVQV